MIVHQPLSPVVHGLIKILRKIDFGVIILIILEFLFILNHFRYDVALIDEFRDILFGSLVAWPQNKKLECYLNKRSTFRTHFIDNIVQ